MSISKTNLSIQMFSQIHSISPLVVSSWEIQGQLIDHRKGAFQAEAIQDLGVETNNVSNQPISMCCGLFSSRNQWSKNLESRVI